MYQVANFVRNSRFYNEILDSRRIEKGVGEVDKKPVTRGCCSIPQFYCSQHGKFQHKTLLFQSFFLYQP